MSDHAELTDANIIGQYLKIRDFVAAQGKAFAEKMKPYNDAMETLEATMSSRMSARGMEEGEKGSIATVEGTCFRKKTNSIRVTSREDFMDFVFDGRREGFLTNHVGKEAVEEYVEQFKSIPPGIEIVPIFKVQFRSPK